mgnify:FL=1
MVLLHSADLSSQEWLGRVLDRFPQRGHAVYFIGATGQEAIEQVPISEVSVEDAGFLIHASSCLWKGFALGAANKKKYAALYFKVRGRGDFYLFWSFTRLVLCS